MQYVAIAPHADDELVGFLTKIEQVKTIVFVCDRKDGGFLIAENICRNLGIESIFIWKDTCSLGNMIESERMTLRDELLWIIGDSPALIPSYIDRNIDHTMLGALLWPALQWTGSLFYSYTDTLPGLKTKTVEKADGKEKAMFEHYPQEAEILKSKGIILPECFYEEV